MPEFHPNEGNFTSLEGKVIVLTGGASGIGLATTARLHSAGAHIYVGDIAPIPTALSSLPATYGSVKFVDCDVSSYVTIYNLFRTAYHAHGRVDHAIGCTGILEQGKWFDPELTIESVREPETSKTLDVNLGGMVNFARLGIVFLREGLKGGGGEDRSLTFLASVASIRDSPGLFMYQTSKHGILGLMRSMRGVVYKRDGVRVNSVCPGMTESAMTTNTIGRFREKGLHTQTSDDVAKFVVGLGVEKEMNGKAVYVEGGRGWEFEDEYMGGMEGWLGEEPTRFLRENKKFVDEGGLLVKD